MNDLDHRLTKLAEDQLGLIAWRQAVGFGLTENARRHRLRRGDWLAWSPRVARHAGTPATDAQRALAAALDAGPAAFVSHHAAAALWGLPGFTLDPLELIVTRSRSSWARPYVVHHPRHLPDPFATVLDGVPVVRPAVVLLQLAPLVHPEKLKRLFDWCWNRRLLSAPSVRRELDPLMHRGRPGTAALRELLDRLPDDYVPPASNLEARFDAIVTQAGFPPMRRQVDLGDDERWCGRVDFVAADLPLVIEVDSDRYHSALSDEADDCARQARLDSAGFVVERVSEFAVWHRPREVVDAVRRARSKARLTRAA
ncbi:endonuclease domain-containing protein [Iamia sp.]|uniref:endonuclease domain-containing protein n=1 Tax=Iamia sp. TaxID=2722710 RepID=UPI002B70FEBD|nr:DUF559 domain-containing protein [Iamia sp.]HXH56874.1 DUF559 domain-containing protein [Iamia sp.]